MASKLSDVTIIIPIYCTTEESVVWLQECLASAFAQKCNVVVYDDGSTIDIAPALGIYLHGYTFTKVDNHGVSYARNRAIEGVMTELVLPLDCDDRLASGAVSEMLEYWNRFKIPVYSDIKKFGLINDPHFHILDFACAHIQNHVGFTAVSVLHAKSMWKQIGGYDESLAFFEDGEYNARLMGTFCGVRCPKPLVEYRFHEHQRTKAYASQSAKFAKQILEKIRSYEMACPGCGKRRTNSLNKAGNNASKGLVRGQVTAPLPSLNVAQDVSGMSTMDDKGYVLAQYVGGKGRGKHYYRGPSTNNAYRVTYGLYLYVDKNDTREPNTTGKSYFVRVVRPVAPAVKAQPAPVVAAPIAEIPTVLVQARRVPVRTSVAKTPVWEAPNIAKMRLVDIQQLELTPTQAAVLLEQEETGRTRAKVIEWLALKADEK